MKPFAPGRFPAVHQGQDCSHAKLMCVETARNETAVEGGG